MTVNANYLDLCQDIFIVFCLNSASESATRQTDKNR